MSMANINFKCPYCGFEMCEDVAIEIKETKVIATCSVKNGGCGKDFALYYRLRLTYHSKKIEE